MNVLAGNLAAMLDPVAFARGLGFVAEPWQELFLRSTSSRQIVACARQVGKSHTTAIKADHAVTFESDVLVLLISPSQRQSNELLAKCRQVHRQAGSLVRLVKDNDGELGFENGSRIVSLPGTDSTTRGFSDVRLLVIDEAARVEDGVFAGVLPMLGSRGQLLALSTPWGQDGWFFRVWEEPANGWQRHRVTVRESGQWDEARIEEARLQLGSHVFAADCLAEFQDTDQQLFSTQAISAAKSADVAPLFGGAA